MTVMVEIKLTPRQIAEAFCELNDEQQAQVFIEAAIISSEWKNSVGTGDDGTQWHSVGKHLAECACSSEAARDIVRAIAGGMQ